MPERRYALRRLAAGDYVWPADDGVTWFRIARGEDGPSYGLEDWSRDRPVWRVFRWPEPVVGDHARRRTAEACLVDPWTGNWDLVADHLATRREAIDEAMRLAGTD